MAFYDSMGLNVSIIPDGSLSEDQMSSWPHDIGLTGGQLMTGQTALPDSTGPRPLLRPAAAINTVGIPSPVEHKTKIRALLYII